MGYAFVPDAIYLPQKHFCATPSTPTLLAVARSYNKKGMNR